MLKFQTLETAFESHFPREIDTSNSRICSQKQTNYYDLDKVLKITQKLHMRTMWDWCLKPNLNLFIDPIKVYL